MIQGTAILMVLAQTMGASECGFPTGRYLSLVAITYIEDTTAQEKTDTLDGSTQYQVYAKAGQDWVLHGNKCWLLAWENDTARAHVLSDTVLVLTVSENPPCGEPQKRFLVAEKFYWLDKKGRYKEWEPGEGFAGKGFKLYKQDDFYYMAYQGQCFQANKIGDKFEVQFQGDTVGVFALSSGKPGE